MSVRVMFSYRGSKLFLQFHYLFTAALHRHGPVLFFIFSIVFFGPPRLCVAKNILIWVVKGKEER